MEEKNRFMNFEVEVKVFLVHAWQGNAVWLHTYLILTVDGRKWSPKKWAHCPAETALCVYGIGGWTGTRTCLHTSD